jgi:hypothetical protein
MTMCSFGFKTLFLAMVLNVSFCVKAFLTCLDQLNTIAASTARWPQRYWIQELYVSYLAMEILL